MTMDYWQCYKRNIGLFTKEQQQRLREAKVVVAGVGGVGGIEAATLAKMGIGELTLFDPGVFDEPDMNRQFGAIVSNIGRNKAVSTAELLQEINPFMKVTALDYAPESDEELKKILENAAVAIDAIDYLGFDYKARFAQMARQSGLYNFTAPISGLGTALFIFAPDGMTLETLYDAPEDTSLWPSHQLPLDRLLGPNRFGGLVTDMNDGRRDYLSNCGGIATLNGGFVATEIALYITGLRPKNELVVAPRALYVDLLRHVFEVYDLKENQPK
jgi:molybdopterin/thiamine biosynthesis adenylyltransferase